jgi:adenosine deaminase
MGYTRSFIEGLPKAELHLHIEGTLEPEMMIELAERNRVPLAYHSLEELRNAYEFENLQSFLDLYYQGMAVLLSEQDFYDLTSAYLKTARGESVRHAEIFFDPQAHTGRGVAFATVIDGIHRAQRDAERDLGITSKLIMCFLRDLDAQSAMKTLDEALAYRDRIVGVGLDSAEVGHPPSKFAAVFETARGHGFLPVAHAGEEGPASYVAEALDVLQVVRIDHGIRSLDDAALVERLVAAQTPLTVCPLSNVKLRVVENMAMHPIKEMLAGGLFVTVNSDDPPYFGGYVNENYRAIQEVLNFTDEDLAQLARNSFQASFLDPEEKTAHIAAIDAYMKERTAA